MVFGFLRIPNPNAKECTYKLCRVEIQRNKTWTKQRKIFSGVYVFMCGFRKFRRLHNSKWYHKGNEHWKHIFYASHFCPAWKLLLYVQGRHVRKVIIFVSFILQSIRLSFLVCGGGGCGSCMVAPKMKTWTCITFSKGFFSQMLTLDIALLQRNLNKRREACVGYSYCKT